MRSMILVLPGDFRSASTGHPLGIHWALDSRMSCKISASKFTWYFWSWTHGALYLKTYNLIRNSHIFAYSSESAVWYIHTFTHLAGWEIRERPPLDAWWWVWHSNSPETTNKSYGSHKTDGKKTAPALVFSTELIQAFVKTSGCLANFSWAREIGPIIFLEALNIALGSRREKREGKQDTCTIWCSLMVVSLHLWEFVLAKSFHEFHPSHGHLPDARLFQTPPTSSPRAGFLLKKRLQRSKVQRSVH